MVEILCPHCEGEIELDDDASGEFECPLCAGEFEWNMDNDDDSYEPVADPDDVIITTDFKQMPAVPKVAGIAFCVWMVLVIGTGLLAMIGGLVISSAESELGTGTSFGAIFVIISLVMLGVGITGMIFGVRTAKNEDFMSLIVITIISGVLLLFYIFGFEDAADIPMIIIAAGFVIGNMCCIFVPILKAQFTGVLVTRDSSVPRKSMANEFDKTKPIHPFEWTGHAMSIVLLIIVIICLSSSSYYTVESNEGLNVEMDLSGPTMTGIFGFLYEQQTYSEIVDDYELTYNAVCLENSDSECDILKSEMDYWKSWRTSTLILKIMLIISLVVCIIGVTSRGAAILSNTGMINLPDKGYMVNDMVRKFSPLVASVVLMLGMFLFMIIQPGDGNDYWLEWGFEEVDTSLGAVVWIGLVFSIITPILTKFEIDYS